MAEPEVEIIDLTGLSESSESDHEDEDEESGSENGSDESEVEILLNEETRTQLHAAIATVSETRLRHVLRNLIDREQAVAIALTREFVTLRRETHTVVPRWERCMNCDVEIDTNTRREDDECAFHPGELEIDDEGFADWDEDVHGPRDTAENRKQYPEEFKWTCCDNDGTASGCVQGEHKPTEISKKRKRD